MSTKAIPVVVDVNEVVTDAKQVDPDREVFTNWNIFNKTKLHPTYMRCESNSAHTGYNSGCHTQLPFIAKSYVSHLDNGHGGGIFISFRENFKSDMIGAQTASTIAQRPEAHPIWDEFKEHGIELRDFRCDVCDAQIKLNPNVILRHCKPHTGKSTRLRPGGDFWLYISHDYAAGMEDEE